MPLVMARHDAISKSVVERTRGTIVKMTGDGIHAAFDRPLDALIATLEIQQQVSRAETADGLALPLRCGLHAGIDERRDGDFYGRAVNRAARIMCAAHGGQMLMSKAVAEQVSRMLPDGASLRDLGVVRLRDLSSPEHIFQLLHPQLRADFPALRSLEGTPNNLTQQLNSFIGRERELAEIKEMLASNRLVTLLGMGGIGKSRLSTQLAAEVLDDFPDGVWFVELAPLTDARLVPQALASVLGVKEEAGRPVIEALLKYVRDKRLLVVLDNCEHVVHACADLAKQLLQAGSGVKVLTSSRDYLQIAGETTYHVPTLSAPDPQAKESLSALAAHEAVRLFIDRVTAARPEFVLTGGNATAVADICHQLDGIPLAIELAAARARALSVENIAARLNDRFKLLVTSDRTVLPRQRTLRALIDWSYDLLDERERAAFQRLAVFTGGWTLEGAEAICAAGPIEASDVVDLQSQLVEKSLIVMEVSGERYRMLDTVRHYALEKLDAFGDNAAARQRHLDFYSQFVEQLRPRMLGPDQGTCMTILDHERENILAAHAWCDRSDRGAETDLRMVFALKFYWLNRGLLGLGYRVTSEALARPHAQSRTLSRCRGLADAGQICYFMGRYTEAHELLQQSLSIARELNDGSRVVAVLQLLGMVELALGNPDAALACCEEAVALARTASNKRTLAATMNTQAQVLRAQGVLDRACPLYTEFLSLARELCDDESVAIGLLNLAMVAVLRDQPSEARRLLGEVLTIVDRTGSKAMGQSLLEVCAGLAVAERDLPLGAEFFGAAEAQADRSELRRDPADQAFLSAAIARARAALGPMALERESVGRSVGYDQATQRARRWLAATRP